MKAKKDKNDFYSLKKILKAGAQYNVIFGQRSNGKTYAALRYALKRHIDSGYTEQFAIVRRWYDDLRGKRGASMFDNLVSNGVILELTNNQYDCVVYRSLRWYLAWHDEDNTLRTCETPFAYGFALSQMEHDKSTSYPNVKTVIFDEFICRGAYLNDEFVLFMNTVSTIVRARNDVTIFMLGNTVNRYNPYFTEMGLSNAAKMSPGTLDVYTYGDSNLKVAVEYTAPTEVTKKSADYFAFNNPKLNMITGGVWELDIYPHCPRKHTPKEIAYSYFIRFNDEIVQCDMIYYEDGFYTFVHRKSGEIKNPERDLVFQTNTDPRPNIRTDILRPRDRLGDTIAEHFRRDKVFYQDNEVGEIVHNYILWCSKK